MDYTRVEVQRGKQIRSTIAPAYATHLTLATSPEYTCPYSTILSSQKPPQLSAFLWPPDLMVLTTLTLTVLNVSGKQGHVLLCSQPIHLCFLSSNSSLKVKMSLFLVQHPKHMKHILLLEPGSTQRLKTQNHITYATWLQQEASLAPGGPIHQNLSYQSVSNHIKGIHATQAGPSSRPKAQASWHIGIFHHKPRC